MYVCSYKRFCWPCATAYLKLCVCVCVCLSVCMFCVNIINIISRKHLDNCFDSATCSLHSGLTRLLLPLLLLLLLLFLRFLFRFFGIVFVITSLSPESFLYGAHVTRSHKRPPNGSGSGSASVSGCGMPTSFLITAALSLSHTRAVFVYHSLAPWLPLSFYLLLAVWLSDSVLGPLPFLVYYNYMAAYPLKASWLGRVCMCALSQETFKYVTTKGPLYTQYFAGDLHQINSESI